MAKFKVGDRVRRIIGSHQGMQVGDTATISKVSTTSISLSEYSGTHSFSNFELVKENNVKKSTQSNPVRSWSFESRASRDIDFDKIYDELDYTNPIALVEASQNCVVIHRTLLLKSETVGIPIPTKGIYKTPLLKHVYELIEVQPSVIVEWAKQVKNSPWPKEMRYKQTVTVNLLNI